MIATLSSKGQLTLPKEVREIFDLKQGDKINVLVRDNVSLELIPVKQPVQHLKGLLPKPDSVVTVEEMNMSIAKGLATS